jgi:hypothetical protein
LSLMSCMHSDASQKAPEQSRAWRSVISIIVAALESVSCQPLEQGYWTKPGMSEAPQSAEYQKDSEECARQGVEQVAMNRTFEGDTIVAKPSTSDMGSTQYSQCMMSRGYEWVKLQPLVPPSPHRETASNAPCPSERIVLDPFGYPHCAMGVPSPRDGTSNLRQDTQRHDSTSVASPTPTAINPPAQGPPQGPVRNGQSPPINPSLGGDKAQPDKEFPPSARREFDNSICIQHSRESLSSPYDTYLRCMEEKGWPAAPR